MTNLKPVLRRNEFAKSVHITSNHVNQNYRDSSNDEMTITELAEREMAEDIVKQKVHVFGTHLK